MVDFDSWNFVTGMGFCSFSGGIILFIILRVSQFKYEKAHFSASAQKTKTWSSLSNFGRGLTIIGIILFPLGFKLPNWGNGNNTNGIREKEWYGPWSTTFYGDDQLEEIVSVKFSQYTHKVDGSHQFCALLYDDEGRKIAEMFQLKEGRNDFQNVKGTFKARSQAWVVEISLLSDKESFAGVLRKNNSAAKVLCFGRKK